MVGCCMFVGVGCRLQVCVCVQCRHGKEKKQSLEVGGRIDEARRRCSATRNSPPSSSSLLHTMPVWRHNNVKAACHWMSLPYRRDHQTCMPAEEGCCCLLPASGLSQAGGMEEAEEPAEKIGVEGKNAHKACPILMVCRCAALGGICCFMLFDCLRVSSSGLPASMPFPSWKKKNRSFLGGGMFFSVCSILIESMQGRC